ncbi:TPA: conserved virulence factor C family protein [Bacillus mobilis]|uniref:conserved virulence factor C family protein n=1 Tax=Bacillus mobilis TaxID=2026190 RepID=UPI00119F8208|nr:conserved virulence factor C family protein [Bacillus mobilis]MED4386085.1 conserved virulence factor C family protein [Bacillus mobilis]HDX9640571.1 conserved virulence factor C family protein [Bacillus mobilis]
MKIKAIEPTPSPNTMKVILNEVLPAGARNNYTNENKEQAPMQVQEILKIEGIKGVYHVADFLAVERNAKFDWKVLLQQVRAVFGEEVVEESEEQQLAHFGEVKVFVQMFFTIPMQVKLTDGTTEERVGLPDRFKESIMKVQMSAPNVVKERKWVEQSTRYGNFEEIGKEVVEEIVAAYSEERVNETVKELLNQAGAVEVTIQKREPYKVTEEMMKDADWKNRFAALEQMDPTEEDMPVLKMALDDEKVSIRRLATAYLGMVKGDGVLPLLYKALLDRSVSVRRTAGDCLSDVGDPAAMFVMIKSLKDSSKLVRWRAAMFLFELGDESAIPALKAAQDDPEFEVAMQARLALERIEGGEEAKGSVWKQMTESRKGE